LARCRSGPHRGVAMAGCYGTGLDGSAGASSLACDVPSRGDWAARECPQAKCMRGTPPPRSAPRRPPGLSLEQVACNSRGLKGHPVGRRKMRALGVLFILLGLAVAAFAVRSTGPDGAIVADGHPAGAPNPSAAAGVAQVVYVAPTRPASAPTAVAVLGPAGAAKGDLVSALQRQLTRVGCYGGEINGIWSASTRGAMEALIQRVNARLPTAQPDPVHLALAQSQRAGICEGCPKGEDNNKSDGRCVNRATVAMLAATAAPVRTSERTGGKVRQQWQMPRPRLGARGPTEGRMGLSVSGSSMAAAAPGARRRSADQGSRIHHRAGRRHRTIVAHKPPQYLRPMRPMRYADRRPWGGFFAALFGW
jgi:hypothetical protein